MWRFHSLLLKSREFIWIKESEKKKKNLRYFRQCLLRLHRNSKKKKKVNIHRFDHIQSFKYSIFSFKSLFMSLILEVSQHWFFNSIQGIAWTDKLETQASSLSFFFWDWDLAFGIMLTIPFDYKRKNRTKKGCGSFLDFFLSLSEEEKLRHWRR